MKTCILLSFTGSWTLFFSFVISFLVMSEGNRHLSSQHPQKRQLLLRLFLIRHGETESNAQKIVIGQSDSPLTTKGIEQTKLLGERLCTESSTNQLVFWRIYSSDLQRAQHTTQLLVQELEKRQQPHSSPIEKVRVEPRLRELARGAREGLPKALSEMEAFSERERLGMMDPIPLLESPQEGWNRVADWLEEVMEDAIQEEYRVEDDKTMVLNLLVITHSGLLRIFLERLLGLERLQQHPDARFEDKNGLPVFSIPNSSLTILNIDLSRQSDSSNDGLQTADSKNSILQIEQLANTEHYSRIGN